MADDHDRDLLQCIFHCDDGALVAKLIEAGADYKVNDHQPMRIAAEKFRPESFKALIEHGYRPTFERGESHLDPVPDLVLKYVLTYFRDSSHKLIEVLDFIPSQRVMEAAISSRTRSLKIFLDRGADPNGRGSVPLLACAAYNNLIEAAKLLLEYGADPYAQERCAIKIATQKGLTEFANLLERFAIHYRLNRAQQAVVAAGAGPWF